MKRFMQNISLFILVLTAATGFVACSNHEPVIPIEYIDRPGFKVEIHVRNNPAASNLSRAAGPSDEDGYYAAFEHEHRVSDATIFFYQAEDGIEADAKTKIEYAVYIPTFASRKFDPVTNDEDKSLTPAEKYDYVYYTPKQILCDKPIAKGKYHILIVCNQGDLTGWKDVKNLGDIRNAVTDHIYFRTGSNLTDCAYFSMVSDEDRTIEVGDFSPSDDPDLPNTNIINLRAGVERMAARIDFSPGDGKWRENAGISFTYQKGESNIEYSIGKSYVYKVDKTEQDTFYLTSIVPVNLYNGDEYFIKRVSTNDKPSVNNPFVNYLRQESGNANYVLDPNTLKGKTAIRLEDVTPGMYENPMNTYYAEDGSKNGICETDYPVIDVSQAKYNYKVEEKEDDGTTVLRDYQVLSYAKENTILVGAVKNLYVTGLVFTGYYARWDSTEEKYTYIPKSYIYYIRHNDPNNTSAEIAMKYGIVRNHIYRVLLKSVNSLGIIEIVVMDWNPIKAPEIDM